jgi:broad-specificity NMP kinase
LEDYYEPIYNNETGKSIGYELSTIEIKITADPICETQTFNRTIYPHTKLSESLDAECMQVMTKKAFEWQIHTYNNKISDLEIRLERLEETCVRK